MVAVTNPQDDLAVEQNPAIRFFATDRSIELRGYRRDPAAANVATATAFKQAIQDHRPTVVSFYGHGGWDRHEAENSAIVLAAPLEPDGSIPVEMGPRGERTKGAAMSAAALRELPLTVCRLAILAGCETGMIGLERTADEFIGLPAALLEAGAAGILASLWPVDALATHALVRAMLTRTMGDGLSPTQALRLAQLQLRDEPDTFAVGHDGFLISAGPANPEAQPNQCPRPAIIWAAFTFVGA